ncbi:hypothetical protein ACHAPA_000408 [Fusarium lateritium]
MAAWMNFNFWRPTLANDGDEDRPAKSRWLGRSRAIQFDDGQWVSVPEAVLEQHPGFLSTWAGAYVLLMMDIPYHVSHIIMHYLYTDEYQNLKVQKPTEAERNLFDFTTAVYTHNVCIKYRLPGLRQLAGERIIAYGDKITFIDIVKTLSNKPFEAMTISGQLHDYVCLRASKEGQVLSDKSTTELQQAMGGTMAGILCQKIASLEAENKALRDVLGSK